MPILLTFKIFSMRIKELELINFKKFSYIKLNFHDGINFIIGKNGTGKTTIIEAISYISTPKSFRKVKDEHLIKFNENGFSIKAKIQNLIENDILITYQKGGLKTITLNGKKVKLFSHLIKEFPILTFYTNNYTLIDQTPSMRRKFFDWFFSTLNYEYYSNLYKYRKILLQKNEALKQKGDVSVWNKQLEQYAQYLIKMREEYIKKLNSLINEIDKDVKMDYYNSLKDKSFDEFLEVEMEKGFSIVGPHRDDYNFYYKEHNAKIFASEGERRKIFLDLAIAMIKLIKSTKDIEPIVIFDDPFNVLDEYKLQSFFDSVKDMNLQFIITSVKPVSHLKGHVINLNTYM